MKVYFASLTWIALAPVDAQVQSVEEGAAILDALRRRYSDHDVVLRARIKKGSNYELKFIGLGRDADDFIARVQAGELNIV